MLRQLRISLLSFQNQQKLNFCRKKLCTKESLWAPLRNPPDAKSTTRDKNRMSLSCVFVMMASSCSSSARFAQISLTVEEFIEVNKNENTRRETKQDVTLFQEFISAKEEPKLVEEIPAETLNGHLSDFIIIVRKEDNGDECEPILLRSMMASFERLLWKKNYGRSVSNDPQLEQARKALKSKKGP